MSRGELFNAHVHVHVSLTQCGSIKMEICLGLQKQMGRILHPTRWYTQAGNIGKHTTVWIAYSPTYWNYGFRSKIEMYVYIYVYIYVYMYVHVLFM